MNALVITFLLGFLLWLLASIIKNIKKIRFLKAARRHLKDAPAFADNLIDCYVKFRGKVAMKDQHFSPLLHKPCVLYQTKVFAEWQTKLKKPKRGMTTNRKTIYNQQSPYPLSFELLAADGTQVYFNFDDFNRPGDFVELSSNKSESLLCPDLCVSQAQSKYQQYTAVEKWLASDTAVLVYGKLEKSSAGLLSLVPTGISHYPNVFQVRSKSEDKLDAKIGKKALFSQIALACRIALLLGLVYMTIKH